MIQHAAVTPYIEAAFVIALRTHAAEGRKWTELSHRLAGRVAVVPLAVNLQRIGHLDLVLRSMEDEHAEVAANNGSDLAFHYQMMLSETWVVACYEALRAIRQRENEFAKQSLGNNPNHISDGISNLASFRGIFADFELLRMPIAKYEIAKDDKLGAPLVMWRSPANGDASDEVVYDKKNPSRTHIMPAGLSSSGSVMWQAFDHRVPSSHWIDRRELSNRMLALADEIEPAGLREARLAAEKAKPK